MSRKIILIKQELLLLVYELNRSGLLAENEKIRPILAQLEKLLLCDLSPSTDRKSGSAGMPRPISYAVFCLKKKKKSRLLRFGGDDGSGVFETGMAAVCQVVPVRSNDRSRET